MKMLDDETYKALGVKLPDPAKIPEGMFTPITDRGHTNRQPLAVAYGLLWLFQGDTETRPHDALVFSARQHLFDMLTTDECKYGIAFAKEIAAAKGVDVTKMVYG